jgi:hydroxypyruvate isomerase
MATRRNVIKNIVLGTSAVLAVPAISLTTCSAKKQASLKGNINHSVARWTYSFLSLDELCNVVKKIGFSAIDLVGPKEWNVLKNMVLIHLCVMVQRYLLPKGGMISSIIQH